MGGKMGGAMPGDALEMPLTFDFPMTSAKDLAPLRLGQLVTIEGLCAGTQTDETQGGAEVIHFRDARLIQIHEDGKKTVEKK
jgi:hypothetical protein